MPAFDVPRDEDEEQNGEMDGIAIIGMAGRFPGANTIEAFWQNLSYGLEAITFLSPEEDMMVVRNPALRTHPQYVPAGAFLDGIDLFDAAFFGFSHLEAQLIDPQHRLFLECAWEALEYAGYDAKQYQGRIGVYAGCGPSLYLMEHIYPNRDLVQSLGGFQAMISTEKDYLATRVSYKIGLKGPSMTIQTGCSSSLVAVTLAAQSLLNYQCDMALAGGVSLQDLEKGGYVYTQAGTLSPDGHCRAFDSEARGTVAGSGLGIVVLKRLRDALIERDQIYSVIKGFAVNNDGDDKAGYTAPSVEGQAEVITEALALADFDPATIGYVETHGTGTYIGDPIEIAALTQAFRTGTDKKGFCAIGSVKTNIGHLDSAAGITGLIKTSLALAHKVLPPSLNFNQPNPQIDFANSPFYVNTHLTDWSNPPHSRRAGVSSFGIGGTNAHVVLEEAPDLPPAKIPKSPVLVVLSAKTGSALETTTDNLANHLRAHPELSLADVAYTLQVGRRAWPYRRMIVCNDLEEAANCLQYRQPQKVFSALQTAGKHSLIFMFPGQGAQYINMGKQLYEQEAVYRQWIDHCAALLYSSLGLDLRDIIFPPSPQEKEAAAQLTQTNITQSALFVVEYALARLLQDWGIQPEAMIGHSVGEYVAACLAGVISLEDALFLVAQRGKLMQRMLPGVMISIALTEEDIQELLIHNHEVSLAAINGPTLGVVAGPERAINSLMQELTAKGIDHRRLHTSHAFHSSMVEPMMAEYRSLLHTIRLHPPSIPYISCTTGNWITSAMATDPEYWVQHSRLPVRFADGLATLHRANSLLLEIGPGYTLTTLSKSLSALVPAIPSMRHPLDARNDMEILLHLIGMLWMQGAITDLSRLHPPQERSRVLLPTYPFERSRYWLEANPLPLTTAINGSSHSVKNAVSTPQQTAYAHDGLAAAYVAPRTNTEQQVASIWREFLGCEEISIYDNFFELGGHSLLAIRLLARLREVFQIELPGQILYEKNTIAALSEVIEHTNQSLLTIPSINRNQPLLASWNQQRMWLHDQKYPAQNSRNTISVGWIIRGTLQHSLVEASVNEVITRHETLRTSFTSIDHQLIQIIMPALTVSVPLIDLTHLAEEKREVVMGEQAIQQELLPFDMTRPPLWRLTLYRLSDEKHAWIFTAHASIWDGTSNQRFLSEIALVFYALVHGQPWQLPELPVQFADFVAWERQHFQGERLEELLSYWRHKLAGELTPLTLPTDQPRLPDYSLSKLQQWHLPETLSKRVRALAVENSATVFIVTLAALKILSYSYTGQEDMLVTASLGNRERPEIHGLIAPIMNTVILRTNLSGNPRLIDVLIRVRETVMEAMAHRDIPLSKLLEEVYPQLYADHDNLGQILTIQHEDGGEPPSLPGFSIERRLWFRRALADIFITMVDEGKAIRITWEYDSYLFYDTTITRIFRDYVTVLEELTITPNKRLSELIF